MTTSFCGLSFGPFFTFSVNGNLLRLVDRLKLTLTNRVDNIHALENFAKYDLCRCSTFMK